MLTTKIKVLFFFFTRVEMSFSAAGLYMALAFFFFRDDQILLE